MGLERNKYKRKHKEGRMTVCLKRIRRNHTIYYITRNVYNTCKLVYQ